MTDRERFLATMLFGVPDRIPYRFGWPRESTLEAWYRQGLPRGIDFAWFVGMDRTEGLPVNLGPVPAFQPVVLEETDRHKVWIDELGAKRLDHKRLPTPGFVTRRWLEFPVKTREDFRRMKERYDPLSPERYPADWDARCERYRRRDFVLMLAFPSMFWRVRDWVGLEGLCYLMVDDPGFVHEMMDTVADFTIAALDRALREVDLDWVYFNEDMAYKHASMISPAMVREFLWPRYRRLVRFFRERGVSVLVMDCDGYIGDLIPLWLDVGINAVGPLEIAAGNDPVVYRKLYGRDLAMMGGIDKRELRQGKEEVRREVLGKVPWLVAQGGYIPEVDHGVPPDIPLRNYLYMVELLKEIACGGRFHLFEPPGALEAQLGPIQEMWTPNKAWRLPGEDA